MEERESTEPLLKRFNAIMKRVKLLTGRLTGDLEGNKSEAGQLGVGDLEHEIETFTESLRRKHPR